MCACSWDGPSEEADIDDAKVKKIITGIEPLER